MLERESHIPCTPRAKEARCSRAPWALIVMLFAILSCETLALDGGAPNSFSSGSSEPQDRALLADAAELMRDLEGRGRSAGIEGYYPVHLFVSHSFTGSILRKVSVELVDEEKAAEYWFSAGESSALDAGGLHKVVTWWLPPGEYRIQGNLVAEEDLHAANIPRVNISSRIALTVAPAPNYVELSLTAESSLFGLKETALLTVRSWSEDSSQAVSAEHHRRQMNYYSRSGENLQARLIARAFGINRGEGRVNEEVVYSANAGGAASSTVEPGASPNLRDWYRQYQTALGQLRAGREGVALDQLIAIATAPAQDLGDNVDTARLLQDRINTEVGFHFLKTGRNVSAAQCLRRVRRLSPYADKALIGLGWALLRPVERKLDSEDAAKSSSGYLWSGSEDYVAWARRNAPYRNAWSVSSGEKLEDLRNALAPWLELVAGDSLRAEVQEGLLVIPYALTHFGALDKAEQRYEHANSELSEASLRLTTLLQSIRQGDLAGELVSYFSQQHSGWRGCLCGFDSADPQALGLVTEEPAVMAEIDMLRQWVELRQWLRSHHSELLALKARQQSLSGDGSQGRSVTTAMLERLANMDRRLSQRISLQSGEFNQLASQLLIQHIDRTDAYLAESRFAIARLNERRREQLLGYRQPEGSR